MTPMFITMGSLYENSSIDTPNFIEPIMVTSAGHDVILQAPEFRTIRPNGRQDYQIIYVKKGCIYYYIDDIKYQCPENSFLIYRPFEPNYYVFYLADNPDLYWIHFTGGAVEEYLDSIQLGGNRHHYIQASEEYSRIWDAIIHEFQHKAYNYVEITNLLFKELLMHLSRGKHQEQATRQNYYPEVDKAITYLNANYTSDCDLNAFVASLNVSPSWFIKLFKRKIGMSPHQYLTNLRINKAKSMMSSSMSIGEIARAVGYQDQLYFSRVFRQKTGISPSEYKQKHLLLANSTPWKYDDRLLPDEKV